MLRGAVIASLAVAGAAVIAPHEANAAYLCGQGQICLYQNINETGSVAVEPRLNPDSPGFNPNGISNFQNSHYTNGQSLNDSVSSVENNSDYDLVLFENADYGGNSVIIAPHQTVNLTSVGIFEPGGVVSGDFNDEASSGYAFSL